MMNVIASLVVGQHNPYIYHRASRDGAQANAAAVANGLTNSLQQAIALESLIAQYNGLNTARMPGGAAPPLRMATGGRVPVQAPDKVPAL